MIELNLIAEKKELFAPVIAGIDLSKVPWIKIVLSYFIYSYGAGFFEDYLKGKKEKYEKSVDVYKKEEKEISQEIKKNEDIKKIVRIAQS